jgi:hypothetical protein
VFSPLKAPHCAFCIVECVLLFEFQSFFFSLSGSLTGVFPLFIYSYINIIFQKSSYKNRPTTKGPKSLKLLYSIMKYKHNILAYKKKKRLPNVSGGYGSLVTYVVCGGK